MKVAFSIYPHCPLRHIFVKILHIKHPNCILFFQFMFFCRHLWRYFQGIILEMQKADGRWERLRSVDWPIETACCINTTLYTHPSANQPCPQTNLSPLPPKSNPILLKLNVELSNPVRGTSNNLFSNKIWLTPYSGTEKLTIPRKNMLFEKTTFQA